MMRNSTQQPLTLNETSSFIDTTIGLDEFTYGNYSDNGDDEPPVDGWPYFDIYVPSYWAVILSIVVLGIAGNILLCIMMSDAKLNFLSYSVFLKWLAVSDSLLLGTRFIIETERVFSLRSVTVINEALCKILTTFRIFVMILSPWLVAGLALDRYVCVCWPLKRDVLCTRMKARIVCSVMLGMSTVFMIPIYTELHLVEGHCIPTQEVYYYFIFIRLLLMSGLPCLFILVLNILIIIQLKRSHAFRKTFTRSGNDAGSHPQTNATRPLVLICIMAFATLMPTAVLDAYINALIVLDIDENALILSLKIWPLFLIVYLLNFGQNFYILIGSSSNYRNIIKRSLVCCRFKQNKERRNTTMNYILPASPSDI
ncbi:type-1B angiotensin II receptor-like [Gigantopelta aegis]|uniref:type-1B angiotensin II receptor-like n=1 Tax=Gigantopelta aegis TaxID=1735272 RepID=UPI001B88ADDF|nr:type-1B angiotensin II receptor-like [Gigantopelta aegis]